jgi:hypothetical protein
MKLPSKIICYDESVLSKLTPVLNILADGDITLLALYNQTKKIYINFEEYLDVLDCLFALKKIKYLSNEGVLHYVA